MSGREAGKECKVNMVPAINMTETGNNIIALRKAAGLTVKDIQEVLGFNTPQAVYKWQHGDALPTLDNLVILAKIFNVKVDDILAVDE